MSGQGRVPITERLHPDGPRLERLGTAALLARLHAGDREAVRAVSRALPSLTNLAGDAIAALSAGGRLVYAGAGTSGRLAALDAAECPPTFGVRASRVVALVAGGPAALRRAIEGAEDDRAAARRAVRAARVGPKDLLVAVSASGRTPYATAAIAEARARGARTALLTSNPGADAGADRLVVLDTGAERIAGSTRMKAGTAAKMALGLLSTAVFVRLGAVRGGRMAALRGTNEKLRARAVRNVAALLGVGAAAARRYLVQAGWDVGVVVERHGRGVDLDRDRARAGAEAGAGAGAGARARAREE
ncbi:MAG TPA: N-acetylmuramic acid 6-phosphate etherase [Anaeromyxobacter sp.]|nr:N-acetylmuramic acid 6-phosphate etherase [Anaeromyxobacter sp.]